MIALISPMGLILATWLLLFLMFSGLGAVIQRVLNQSLTSGTRWLEAFWLGWALSILILQLWHFAFPVNDVIFLMLLAGGLLSLVIHRQGPWTIIKRLQHYRLFILIIGLLILWLANRAIDMPTAYDTGLRDIQSVMWIDSYPIVPGLNNLFASLAFNQSSYLYHALLDVGIWSGRAYHISTGLLYAVFLAGAVWSAVQVYRHRDGQGMYWSWMMHTLLIPYILFHTLQRGAITHFLTDISVDLIGFIAVGFILDFVQFYDIDKNDHQYPILKIVIIILTGFTLKQSFIVFGMGLGLLVLIVWIRRGGLADGRGKFVRIVAWVIGYAVLLILPWMARGVVTSGYIAYPQPIGRFDVDWAEPPELIAERQEMLATNTRIRYGDPDEILSSWDWVGAWLQEQVGNIFEFLLPIGLFVGMLMIYGVARIRNRKDQVQSSMGGWVLLPMLVMIVFWFFSAPNIKYIKYILWINVAISAVLAVVAWHQIGWRVRVLGLFAVLGIGLLYIGYFVVAMGVAPLVAGPDNGFYTRPMPPIKVLVTRTGAEINVPDSHINQCWHIPLPCTPIPRTRIYERVSGDLRHGFGLTPKDNS